MFLLLDILNTGCNKSQTPVINQIESEMKSVGLSLCICVGCVSVTSECSIKHLNYLLGKEHCTITGERNEPFFS